MEVRGTGGIAGVGNINGMGREEKGKGRSPIRQFEVISSCCGCCCRVVNLWYVGLVEAGLPVYVQRDNSMSDA